MEDMERNHIERVLIRTGWHVSQAAEILKIDRTTLYNKIKKYNLSK
jgi:transcriptional regulator of acetoin/glycerol metabolism